MRQIITAILIATILFAIWSKRPAEGVKRYQYKVIAVQGATELRKQSDAEQGRVGAIERAINEQAEQGWDFFQADGYFLYFRR